MTPGDVLVFLAATLGPGLIAAAAIGCAARPRSCLALHLSSLVCLCLLTAACVPLSGVVVAPPTAKTPLLAAAMAIAVVVALGPGLAWLAAAISANGHGRGLARLDALPLWSVALAILVGAICEEYLYRAVAWTLLSASLGPVPAMLAVAALFGLAHLPLWGPGPAVSTGIAGLAFNAAYFVHEDLYANMLAHGVSDVAGLILPRIRPASRH